MIDEEKDNGTQGELFNELRSENELLNDSTPVKVTAPEKHFRLSFDKLLVTILLGIIVMAIAFAVGVERGRKARDGGDKKPSQTAIRESVMPAGGLRVAPAEPKILPRPTERTRPQGLSPTPPELADKWTIQVVTYTSDTHAEREVKKLTNEGLHPFIITSGNYYQVCVNTFDSSKEAQKMLPFFTKEKGYFDAFVRRVKR